MQNSLMEHIVRTTSMCEYVDTMVLLKGDIKKCPSLTWTDVTGKRISIVMQHLNVTPLGIEEQVGVGYQNCRSQSPVMISFFPGTQQH